jgi:integrase
MVMQHKTKRAVQFEITPATRKAVQKWIKQAALRSEDFLFPSRFHDSPHLGTRQYARIVEGWVEEQRSAQAFIRRGNQDGTAAKLTLADDRFWPGAVFHS